MKFSGFSRDLLTWYRRAARPLPWRREPSLYRTVVSEFMLQQTQVATVLPYFQRWMVEFPDFRVLAAAPEARVLKLWEGLGYYRRARHLHQLAKIVAAEPGRERTPEGWGELPGVGPYTAAAITSIAFSARAACVDGNVVRVLTRLTADESPYPDGVSAARVLTPLAEELLPAQAPGDHNQAMMELGATVCLRRNPCCLVCPVRSYCAGAGRGAPEAYPKIAPKKVERMEVTRVWCERRGSLLLHRTHPDSRRLADLHELPTAEQAGVKKGTGPLLARKKRRITRFDITESIHAAKPAAVRSGEGLVWVPWAELDAIALSGPHRRWIAELRRTGGPAMPRSARGKSEPLLR